ncbi:DNA polymerase delta subunit 4 [Perkinsus chesapeaki]|uniref:DNA polymerase delta subunit 4 n=1 Tax=Perkinsus chesapeaki TaxID=330153 RepID=A0A7J6N1T8_PERCH|nr:DNA polymerase delta subunit 4 [Perkinsus chesapeaki]
MPARPKKRPNPNPIKKEVSNSLARRLDFGQDDNNNNKGDKVSVADDTSEAGSQTLTCVDTNVLSWSTDSDCKVVEELILRKFDLDLRFGPCCGISREARYERAKAFGLNPPESVGRALKRVAEANKQVTPAHIEQKLDEFSVLDQHMFCAAMGLEVLQAIHAASDAAKSASFRAEVREERTPLSDTSSRQLSAHEAIEATRYGQEMLDHIAKANGHWLSGRMTPDFIPGTGHVPGVQPDSQGPHLAVLVCRLWPMETIESVDGTAAEQDTTRNVRRHLTTALSLDDIDLQSTQVAIDGHRALLSPSRHGYMPVMKDNDDPLFDDQAKNKRPTEQSRPQASITLEPHPSRPPQKATRLNEQILTLLRTVADPARVVLSHLRVDLLGKLQAAFDLSGLLHAPEFVKAVLLCSDHHDDQTSQSALLSKQTLDHLGLPEDSTLSLWTAQLACAAHQLFERIDVHSTESLTWDQLSDYLLREAQLGLTEEDITADDGHEDRKEPLRTYDQSSAFIQQKRAADSIERLSYLKSSDMLLCLTTGSPLIKIYHPENYGLLAELEGHRGNVITAREVGDEVVSSGTDKTLSFWSISKVANKYQSTKDESYGNRLNDAEGEQVDDSPSLSVDWRLRARLVSKGTQMSIFPFNTDLDDDIGAHSPHNTILFSGGVDGSLSRWDLEGWKIDATRSGYHEGPIYAMERISDMSLLATASDDSTVLMWDVSTLKPRKVLKGTSLAGIAPLHDLKTICYIPEYSRLCAGTSNGRILFYNYKNDNREKADVTDVLGVNKVEYCYDTATFLTVSGHHIRFWSAASGKHLRTAKDITSSEITAAVLAPNQKRIYIGNAKGEVVVCDTHTCSELLRFEPHERDISSLLAPEFDDNQWMISAGWDGLVKVHHINISTQSATSDIPVAPVISPVTKAKFRLHQEGFGITNIALSPPIEGSLKHEEIFLASAGEDCQCVIYDFQHLKMEARLSEFKYPLLTVAWASPNPRLLCLIAADRSGAISLWRASPELSSRWYCIYAWNSAGPSSSSTTTALSIGPDDDGQWFIVIGNSNGKLQVQDLGAALKGSQHHDEDHEWEESTRAETGIFQLTSIRQSETARVDNTAIPAPEVIATAQDAHEDAVTEIAPLHKAGKYKVSNSPAIVTVSGEDLVFSQSAASRIPMPPTQLGCTELQATKLDLVSIDATAVWSSKIRAALNLLATVSGTKDRALTERLQRAENNRFLPLALEGGGSTHTNALTYERPTVKELSVGKAPSTRVPQGRGEWRMVRPEGISTSKTIRRSRLSDDEATSAHRLAAALKAIHGDEDGMHELVAMSLKRGGASLIDRLLMRQTGTAEERHTEESDAHRAA